jgi:hypothetical protein
MLWTFTSFDQNINFIDQDFFLLGLQFGYFEQSRSTSEPIEELIKKELLILKLYQLNVKNIKCPLQWWEKHETMFPIVGFLVWQIMDIVESHIETKRIFSLARILTNLKRCRLQTEFFKKMIFVQKN